MRPALLVAPLAIALLAAAPAMAQSLSDAPVQTAGSSAGGVPTDGSAPTEVRRTPPPPPVQPRPSREQLEAAADQGHKAPLLGDFHGEVGGVVGTGGLRGAYGWVSGHPAQNVTLGLGFSAMHAHGYSYGYPYGPGLYGPGPYGPTPYGAPIFGTSPLTSGWTHHLETDGPPPDQPPSDDPN